MSSYKRPSLDSTRISIGGASIIQNKGGATYILREDDENKNAFVVIPPDGGWGWLVVIAGFICNFIVDGTIYTFGLFLHEIGKSFHIQDTKVAAASSMLCAFYYLTGPITCGLVNQFGYRLIGILGGLIAGIAFIISSVVTTYSSFLVFYGVICGISCGMSYVASVVVIGFYFEKWRGLATSITVTGSAVGVTSFPFIIQYLSKYNNWRGQFQILSSLFFITSICAISYRPISAILIDTENKTVLFSDSHGSIQSDKKNVIKTVYNRFRNLVGKSSITEPSSSATIGNSKRFSSVSSVFVMEIPEGSMSSFAKSTSASRWEGQSDRLSVITEEYTDINSAKCWKCLKKIRCSCRRPKRIPHRPMYRGDIFFSGSLHTLPEYSLSLLNENRVSVVSSAIDYHLSVTKPHTLRDIEEGQYFCICCPESMKTVIMTMFDFRLLKSPSFFLLSLSGFFSLLGLYVPYIYSMKRAQDLHIDEDVAIYFLPVLGISNGIGRILTGIISTIPNVKALNITYISLLICGLSSMVSVFLKDVYGQFCYITVYGMSLASLSTLKSAIIVDMIGLDNLTNAFGILMLFSGFSSLLSLPIAGIIANATHSIEYSFVVSGIFMFVSGILLIPINKLVKWERERQINEDN